MPLESKSPVTLTRSILNFERPHAWKRMGLIALATDLTSERDFAKLMPHDQVGVYTTRVAYQNPTTPENLRHMAPRLTAAAALILPGEPLDVICYSCTAASVVIGDQAVTEAIHAARPGVPVVTPSVAARLAFAALGVRKISILTPYLVETSQPMATYFTEHGMDIQRFECLGLDDDRMMARLSRQDIIEAACRVDVPESEALFISCTGVPAVAVIAEIEKRIGKPVVTSNQASAWAMLHYAGLNHKPVGYGQLFDFDLPTQEPTSL